MILLYWILLKALLLPGNEVKQDITFLSNVKVKMDYTHKGVIGAYITYEISISELKAKVQNDSIVNTANILVQTQLLAGNSGIMTNHGYNRIQDENGCLLLRNNNKGMDFIVKDKKKGETFIPYAAMDLSEGKHVLDLTIKIKASGAFPQVYTQTIYQKGLVIQKPMTYTAIFDIDYVEVNELTPKNKQWDVGWFSTFKPDVSIQIMMANTIVWFDYLRDTYVYAQGPKSRNIKFTISKNDQIRFLVEDQDLIMHDFIGEQLLPFNSKDLGKTQTIKNQFDSVKDCSARYRIE